MDSLIDARPPGGFSNNSFLAPCVRETSSSSQKGALFLLAARAEPTMHPPPSMFSAPKERSVVALHTDGSMMSFGEEMSVLPYFNPLFTFQSVAKGNRNEEMKTCLRRSGHFVR